MRFFRLISQGRCCLLPPLLSWSSCSCRLCRCPGCLQSLSFENQNIAELERNISLRNLDSILETINLGLATDATDKRILYSSMDELEAVPASSHHQISSTSISVTSLFKHRSFSEEFLRILMRAMFVKCWRNVIYYRLEDKSCQKVLPYLRILSH